VLYRGDFHLALFPIVIHRDLSNYEWQDEDNPQHIGVRGGQKQQDNHGTSQGNPDTRRHPSHGRIATNTDSLTG